MLTDLEGSLNIFKRILYRENILKSLSSTTRISSASLLIDNPGLDKSILSVC